MNSDFYQTFPAIDTPRLRLRELTPADAAAIFAVFSDPEVTRYYDVATMTEPAQAEALTERLRRRFHDRTGIRWAIERKADGRVIGTCGYPAIVTSADRGSIGYELARHAWRSGFSSEAVDAIVAFGHQTIQLRRIDALVISGNAASAGLLRKCGFVHEGVLRDYGLFQGRYCDMEMFAHVVRFD